MTFRWRRPRLTYANIASTLALFVALGGSSYAAIKLPRHSVGEKQLRTGSVTGAKIRNRSVRSIDIRNGGVKLKDLSHSTRRTLRGKMGPAGPPGTPGVNYFLEANSAGGHTVGNGAIIGNEGVNGYIVRFPGSVAACALVASPASVPGGLTDEAPPGSTVIVSHQGDNAFVRTFNDGGQPQGLPFSLIAAC